MPISVALMSTAAAAAEMLDHEVTNGNMTDNHTSYSTYSSSCSNRHHHHHHHNGNCILFNNNKLHAAAATDLINSDPKSSFNNTLNTKVFTSDNFKSYSFNNSTKVGENNIKPDEEMMMIDMLMNDDIINENMPMPSEYVWSESERAFEDNEEEMMDIMMNMLGPPGRGIMIASNQEYDSSSIIPSNQEYDSSSSKSTSFSTKLVKSILPFQLPLIDLGSLYSSPLELQQKLSFACQHWGVFYLSNHGISPHLLNLALHLSSTIFALPPSVKRRARRALDGSSFDGFGQPIIAKFFKSRSWTQGFTMMGSSVAHTTSKLLPSPNHPNPFRGPFDEYEKSMRELAGKLLTFILLGLGVDMSNFNHKQFNPNTDCHGALQLNYYPKCPQPKMTIGLPSHTDSTCLTILYQGDVPGLEIYKGGRWSLVAPLPNTLVVNVGDMLQVLSNDKYQSITHRAIPNKRRSRLSIAYLCGPPLNATISPPLEVVKSSQNEKALYRPLTWVEYLETKKQYFTSTLDYFKV